MQNTNYNLTLRQREALRWVVEHIRAGNLQETFEFLWDFRSSIMGGWITEPDNSREFDLETLEAWDRANLVHVKTQERDQTKPYLLYKSVCTITQSAYVAVDTDFTDPEPEPNRERLLDLLSKFGLDELQTMAVRIGADHENIRGETKMAYARELFSYAQRRNLLWKLVRVVMVWK